jgi:hypothetical protein
VAEHLQDVEVLKPRKIWRERHVRERIRRSREPFVLLQRLLHLVEDLDHALHGDDEVL